jgi:hypothetical protein
VADAQADVAAGIADGVREIERAGGGHEAEVVDRSFGRGAGDAHGGRERGTAVGRRRGPERPVLARDQYELAVGLAMDGHRLVLRRGRA